MWQCDCAEYWFDSDSACRKCGKPNANFVESPNNSSLVGKSVGRSISLNPQDQNIAIQRIVNRIPASDRQAVAIWLEKLLQIANLPIDKRDKAKRAIALTKESKVVWPIVKVMATELKRVGWDERNWASRLALSGLIIGLLAFSSEGAGIAAFGTAIGVPLWIVLGSGGALAGAILDEIKKSS